MLPYCRCAIGDNNRRHRRSKHRRDARIENWLSRDKRRYAQVTPKRPINNSPYARQIKIPTRGILLACAVCVPIIVRDSNHPSVKHSKARNRIRIEERIGKRVQHAGTYVLHRVGDVDFRRAVHLKVFKVSPFINNESRRSVPYCIEQNVVVHRHNVSWMIFNRSVRIRRPSSKRAPFANESAFGYFHLLAWVACYLIHSPTTCVVTTVLPKIKPPDSAPMRITSNI